MRRLLFCCLCLCLAAAALAVETAAEISPLVQQNAAAAQQQAISFARAAPTVVSQFAAAGLAGGVAAKAELMFDERTCGVCHAMLDELYLKLGSQGDQVIIGEKLNKVCDDQPDDAKPVCESIMVAHRGSINTRLLEPLANTQVICQAIGVCRPATDMLSHSEIAPPGISGTGVPTGVMEGEVNYRLGSTPIMPSEVQAMVTASANERAGVYPGSHTAKEKQLFEQEQAVRAREAALVQREADLLRRENELKQREENFNRLIATGGGPAAENMHAEGAPRTLPPVYPTATPSPSNTPRPAFHRGALATAEVEEFPYPYARGLQQAASEPVADEVLSDQDMNFLASESLLPPPVQPRQPQRQQRQQRPQQRRVQANNRRGSAGGWR